MANVRFHKVIGQLPGVLEADTIYFVRVGEGFDLYVSDSTGSVAHKVNGAGDTVTPPAPALRTAPTATTRTVYSGHSLEDAAMYGNGWPGDMMRLRNALLDPDDEPTNPVYVVKDTIPGSTLRYRWDATDPSHEFAARLRPGDFESLVTTSAGPPMHDATPFFETEFLDYLCRFAADRIERGAASDIALWTIWPAIDGVNAPDPAGPEWAGHDTFETGLPEYGRIFEKAADYTTWKMHQLYTLPAGWRVWVYPGDRWWTQILADLDTSSVPGVATLAHLFGDTIHPNNWGSWGLALFRYMCERQVDLRGNAVAAALAPADIPAGLHDYFCEIAWDIANGYPRAGLAGTVTDLRFVGGVDTDPMPLWTLADPNTGDPVPVSIITRPSILPTAPNTGDAIALDFGAPGGTSPITGDYFLRENNVVVQSGPAVAGGTATYDVAGTVGQDIVLTVTWDNAYGDPVSDTATVTIGEETPSFNPAAVFSLYATAADYSALAAFTGTQLVVAEGAIRFTPQTGVDVQLRGALPASTGAAGAYMVAAMRCSPVPDDIIADMIMLSTNDSVWWNGSNLSFFNNGYVGGVWGGGASGTTTFTTPAIAAQEGVYAVLEIWTDTANLHFRVNGGATTTVARGEAYAPLTHLHLFADSAAGSDYYVAAMGVINGVPTEAVMTDARAWAQGLIPT